MDIPFLVSPSEPDSQQSYLILFNNGTTASAPLNEMAALIPPPPVNVGASNSTDTLLPPFLCLNLKITYEHEGQYHKSFLVSVMDATVLFSSHALKNEKMIGVYRSLTSR
jgi:hypothetical protein